MNNQFNYNNGPAVNVQGDNNVVHYENNTDLVDRIIEILKDDGEIAKAKEIEELREEGDKTTIGQRIVQWLGERVLSPAVSSAVAPLVSQLLAG